VFGVKKRIESLFFSGRFLFPVDDSSRKPGTEADTFRFFLFFPGQLFVYFLVFSSSSTGSDQVSLLGDRTNWKREYFLSVSEVGTFPAPISFKISSMEAIKR
jgi:hypothetical protein